MKKKILTAVLATTLSISMFTNSYALKDTNKHWAKQDIDYLIENKIMTGYNDDTFRPNNKITRAEFLKLVNNVFDNNKKANINFKDVKEKDWYYDDISKAVGAGYITGYNDNTAKPNSPITREEASKIAVIALGLDKNNSNKNLEFKDNNKIGKWAENYIKIMLEEEYIGGYPEDNTFRPSRNLSRAEAAKILSQIRQDVEEEKQIAIEKEKEAEREKEREKEKEKEKEKEQAAKSVYSVQVSSFSSEKDAMELGTSLLDKGFKDTYIAKDNYGLYYVIANDFKTEEEANKLKESLKKGGFESIVYQKDFKVYEILKPKKTEVSLNQKDRLVNQINSIEDPSNISTLSESLLVKTELARGYYKNLSEKDKNAIPKNLMDKLVKVENKIESLKTPIEFKTKTTAEQAKEWAKSKGADQIFIDVADLYWQIGEETGISPEIMYAQAAKETNYGKYTGSVKPEMNNWAGIKIKDPTGDATYDHETFDTPEDGVRAHFNHMGIYVGVEPTGTPHDRWYITSKVSWAGTVKKVEDLGGKWAPSRDYGISIMRDYVTPMYKY